MKYKREESPLYVKSHAFAVRIVNMVKYLSSDYKIFSMLNQIQKSGTSIAANVSESQFAQSPSDFASKLQIALKEANETSNWLSVFRNTDIINEKQFASMQADCNELIAMLVSSINTIKNNTKSE